MAKKETSKNNAVKHGIFARILLDDHAFHEKREDICALISVVRESIRPSTAFEDMHVEKMAFQLWRLMRTYKADAKIAPKLFARISDFLEPGQPSTEAKWVARKDQVIVTQRDPTSDSLMRYETHLERQICRTLDQLESLRRMRRDLVTSAPPLAQSLTPEAGHEAVS